VVSSHRNGAFQPSHSVRLINSFKALKKATSMPLSRVLNDLAMFLDNLTPQALRTANGEVHQESSDCTSSEECQRLNNAYFAAIERNNDAACAMASFYREGWQDTWHEEMKELREACEKALEALDRHRRDHGC
jgi:hypothetical protein